MMTNEAFNALLKTLEEPPENVVFILATTEPYKLMPTILSRCQRYDFTKVSDGDIYNRLFDILQNENIQIEEDALSMLVSLADGGVRDALSMLDQAIAYCGNNITLKAIQDLYGLSSKQEKIDLLMYANNQDFLKLSNAIKQLVENGVDIKRLTNELLEVLKDLLIYQTTKDASLLKKLTVTDCEYLSLDNKKINAWIDILLNANSQYRLVNNITSLFEITMLKLSSYEEVKPVETIKIVEKVVETKPEPVKEEIKPTPVATPIEETKPNNEEVIPLTFSNVSFTSVNPFVDEGTPINYTMDDVINIMVQATKECKNELNANWHLLDKLISHNRVGKYAATLKNTAPRIVCKTAVVFEASLKTITNKINLKENQYGFSKVVEALFGESCVVICMNHQEYVETVTKFSNLRQANKLPSPQEVNIDTKVEINQNYTKTKTAELAEELTRGEN